MTTQESIFSHVKSHLNTTLHSIETSHPLRRGKVRDILEKGDELILVCTDRVSAFDVILGTFPFKGALLTEQTTFWFKHIEGRFPHHFVERLDPQIIRCKKAQPLPFEIVVRGYLAGSLMREPPEKRGEQYGLRLDPALQPYAAFEEPIITPTTKAPQGSHDLPVSVDTMKNCLSPSQVEQICEIAKALFQLGQTFAAQQGLLLVDTKYELGIINNQLVIIDEIHTADSSRYWLQSTYASNLSKGLPPDMLDKEILRRALLEQGFHPEKDPHSYLKDDLRAQVACEYWKLTETLLGKDFTPSAIPSNQRVPLCIQKEIGSY